MLNPFHSNIIRWNWQLIKIDRYHVGYPSDLTSDGGDEVQIKHHSRYWIAYMIILNHINYLKNSIMYLLLIVESEVDNRIYIYLWLQNVICTYMWNFGFQRFRLYYVDFCTKASYSIVFNLMRTKITVFNLIIQIPKNNTYLTFLQQN